jgi:hypothetical protein
MGAGGAGVNLAPRAAPQSRSTPAPAGESLYEPPRRADCGATSRAGRGVARLHWLASSAADGAKSRLDDAGVSPVQ